MFKLKLEPFQAVQDENLCIYGAINEIFSAQLMPGDISSYLVDKFCFAMINFLARVYV